MQRRAQSFLTTSLRPRTTRRTSLTTAASSFERTRRRCVRSPSGGWRRAGRAAGRGGLVALAAAPTAAAPTTLLRRLTSLACLAVRARCTRASVGCTGCPAPSSPRRAPLCGAASVCLPWRPRREAGGRCVAPAGWLRCTTPPTRSPTASTMRRSGSSTRCCSRTRLSRSAAGTAPLRGWLPARAARRRSGACGAACGCRSSPPSSRSRTRSAKRSDSMPSPSAEAALPSGSRRGRSPSRACHAGRQSAGPSSRRRTTRSDKYRRRRCSRPRARFGRRRTRTSSPSPGRPSSTPSSPPLPPASPQQVSRYPQPSTCTRSGGAPPSPPPPPSLGATRTARTSRSARPPPRRWRCAGSDTRPGCPLSCTTGPRGRSGKGRPRSFVPSRASTTAGVQTPTPPTRLSAAAASFTRATFALAATPVSKQRHSPAPRRRRSSSNATASLSRTCPGRV
mmetsp:Transcript_41444/g.137824  ORF Transcript_41444/g.137824 Transcript_41444/m.137824 type:complete len:451 (+) Transcript_41444:154-1506(+)